MVVSTINIIVLLSLIGLAIAYYYMHKVNSVPLDLGLDPEQSDRLKFIHGAIASGAMAFLKQEYKFMAIFMVAFAAIIAVLIDDPHTDSVSEGVYTAVAFLFGALISIISGWGNAEAAKKEILQSVENYEKETD